MAWATTLRVGSPRQTASTVRPTSGVKRCERRWYCRSSCRAVTPRHRSRLYVTLPCAGVLASYRSGDRRESRRRARAPLPPLNSDWAHAGVRECERDAAKSRNRSPEPPRVRRRLLTPRGQEHEQATAEANRTPVWERALRLAWEHQREYESQWAAIHTIVEELGRTAASTAHGRSGVISDARGFPWRRLPIERVMRTARLPVVVMGSAFARRCLILPPSGRDAWHIQCVHTLGRTSRARPTANSRPRPLGNSRVAVPGLLHVGVQEPTVRPRVHQTAVHSLRNSEVLVHGAIEECDLEHLRLSVIANGRDVR